MAALTLCCCPAAHCCCIRWADPAPPPLPHSSEQPSNNPLTSSTSTRTAVNSGIAHITPSFVSSAMSSQPSSVSIAQPANGASSADTSSSTANGASPAHEQTLVQYIVMRSDLVKQHKWNAGGLIANGSHAAVAVIAERWQDDEVQQYVTGAGGKQMHTVVLAASDEKELMDTAGLLQKNSIVHKVWVSPPATQHITSCGAAVLTGCSLCSLAALHSAACCRSLCCACCVGVLLPLLSMLFCQIEQPESVACCLATRPYHRHILQPILRHLKLFR